MKGMGNSPQVSTKVEAVRFTPSRRRRPHKCRRGGGRDPGWPGPPAAPPQAGPESDRPSCAAGDVAHIRAAATSDAPMWLTSCLSAPSIVSVLPASVPSSRKAASRPTVMVWLPSGTFVPTGRPGAAGAVGDRHRAVRTKGRDDRPRDDVVHVVAVAHELGPDGRAVDDGADESRRAVRERRHAIEDVRGVPASGVDAGQPLLVRRGGMPERHDVSRVGERPHQLHAAVHLGRHRDDAHLGPRLCDLVEESGGPKTQRRRGRPEASPRWAGEGTSPAARRGSPG